MAKPDIVTFTASSNGEIGTLSFVRFGAAYFLCNSSTDEAGTTASLTSAGTSLSLSGSTWTLRFLAADADATLTTPKTSDDGFSLTPANWTENGGSISNIVSNIDQAAAVAAQLATDVAAVTAGKADIKDTRTILGVTGTLETPEEVDGCIVTFVAQRAGAPLANHVFRFNMQSAPAGNGQVFVKDQRDATSADSTGIVTIELPQGSVWTCTDIISGGEFEFSVPEEDSYEVANVSI